MTVLGITGGIGSGKTTVAHLFKVIGIPVYNSDERAKFLVNESLKLKDEISSLLGSEAYADNTYNRKYVASRVFKEEGLLKKLNAIIHPAVFNDFEEWKSKQITQLVVKESAILFQSGGNKHVDAVVLVWVSEEERIKRTLARDSFRSLEQVKSIIAKQGDWTEYKEQSDFIIDNGGERFLIPQVRGILNKLTSGV